VSSTNSRTLGRRHLIGSLAVLPFLGWGTIAGARAFDDRLRLRCVHQRTGTVYARTRVDAGTMLALSWIHSIELTRWTEHYALTPEGFALTMTEISSYGAGMDADDGPVEIEDGRIRTRPPDLQFDALRWIHSHAVDYRIDVTGHPGFVDSLELPHHEPVALMIGRN
jgi:hypothetical protein